MTGTRYLIPRRIRQRYEFFPGSGIGLPEVGLILAGLGAATVWFGGAGLFRLPFLVRLLPALALAGFGYFAARPLPDGTNLWGLAQAFHQWRTRPQRYLYDWSREDY